MKLSWIAVLGIVFLPVWANAEEAPLLKTQKERVNYAIGVNIVNNIRHQGVEVDLDLVIKGMKDAQSGGKLLLSDDELRKSISLYQTAVRQKQSARGKTNAARGKKPEGAFQAVSSAQK